MGKNLIQQRRGKGSPVFRSPPTSKQFVTYPKVDEQTTGRIVDFVHSATHSAPLAHIAYDNGESCFVIASSGMRVGDAVSAGAQVAAEKGNLTALKNIPEGTLIYNVEANPGDGGKFARAGGTAARVILRSEKNVLIELPSKKKKECNPECRAMIGTIAGEGRLDKPLIRAGSAYFKHKARGHFWPVVCGQSMNAVAHPHGGKRSSKKNFPFSVSRSTPPGAKTGHIASRRTGRRKR